MSIRIADTLDTRHGGRYGSIHAQERGPLRQVNGQAVMEFERQALKLLIADDSGPIRARLVSMLTPLVGSMNILEAGDVPTAQHRIDQTHPEVVVLDLDMPGGSGFDLLDTVSNRTSGPLLIVLTNYDEPEIRTLCLRRGAHYFLDKSTEFEKVLDIVGVLLHHDAEKHS